MTKYPGNYIKDLFGYYDNDVVKRVKEELVEKAVFIQYSCLKTRKIENITTMDNSIKHINSYFET